MYFCSECQEEHEIYVYRTFRLEGTTMWGFDIGQIVDTKQDAKIIITKGPYKKNIDAELCANAFIDGIKFADEMTTKEGNKKNDS